MGAEVIEDDPDWAAVSTADRFEEGEEIAGALSLNDMSPQFSGADVVGSHQVTDALAAGVGGPLTVGVASPLPGTAGVRAQLQRPELIGADYGFAPLLRGPVEPFDGVFFTSKSGSVDCFQVLVR